MMKLFLLLIAVLALCCGCTQPVDNSLMARVGNYVFEDRLLYQSAHGKAEIFGDLRDTALTGLLKEHGSENPIICLEWSGGTVLFYNILLITRENLYFVKIHDYRFQQGEPLIERKTVALTADDRDLCLEIARDYRNCQELKPELAPWPRIPCYISIYENKQMVNFLITDFSPRSKETEEMLRRAMESPDVILIHEFSGPPEFKRFSRFLDQVLKAAKL